MTLSMACDLAEYAWTHSDVADEKTDTHVSFQVEGATLYVLFRGSESLTNALDDLEFWRVKWRGISVAEGFRDCYEGVEAGIEAKIAEVKSLTVVYVGHSLGAILAVIGAYASLQKGRPSPAFAIGCPRGISLFSVLKIRKAMSGLVTWWRNDQDIITHLAPVAFLTLHLGKKIQVGKWWRFWTAIIPDTNNAHMVSQYRKHGEETN